MAINYRFKCACGNVFDAPGKVGNCTKCNNTIDGNGMGVIQIYRMGSPIGAAIGAGIYINSAPCGHLANKQSIKILVPYGTYKVHCTLGMTRKCVDYEATVSEINPEAYLKARVKAGFWSNKILVDACSKADMPE